MQGRSQSDKRKLEKQQSFIPCAPDLAYCTDCIDNRQKGNCPRQKLIPGGGKKLGSRSKKKDKTENKS